MPRPAPPSHRSHRRLLCRSSLAACCFPPTAPPNIGSKTVRAAKKKSSTKITHLVLLHRTGARADYVDTFVWMTRECSVDRSSMVRTSVDAMMAITLCEYRSGHEQLKINIAFYLGDCWEWRDSADEA
ncbi:hypothetical protein BD309DRAFT_949773 [Dichomitus squalens]|nr:hypothetical protein BD309DRAFT_949773 [Dichomitus squalens]